MLDPQNPLRKERTQLWPLWVAIGFPLLLIAFDATPVAPNFFYVMLGLPLLFLAWACLGAFAAYNAVKSFRRHAGRQAFVNAVLPLVILGVGLDFFGFIHFCGTAGDTLHFYVRYPAYSEIVRSTPQADNPRLVIINLGGMIWASSGFVYDESDEIMRKPSLQSESWKARAQTSELGCGYGAWPIPGPFVFAQHWYLASFAC